MEFQQGHYIIVLISSVKISLAIIWASLVVLLGKNLPAYAGDPGLIPGSGRSPGERNGSPLQYSCLENLMDRGA